VDLPAGGREVRIAAPRSIALDSPLVILGGGGRGGTGAGATTTVAAAGALELRAPAGLRAVGGGGGVTVRAASDSDEGGELSLTSGGDVSGGTAQLIVGHSHSRGEKKNIEERDDEEEGGRWGALLDALDAGGARAGAGFRVVVGGAGVGGAGVGGAGGGGRSSGGVGGAGRRSSAEVAGDAVRVTAARVGFALFTTLF
jgi:hypothetical protein